MDIEAYRLRTNKTVAELADLLGVKQAAIYNFLRNYGDLILWIYENINDTKSWTSGYESKFMGVNFQ